MEPFSLVLAIGGIPSIFKSCMECFEYIHLGRNFGKDYGFCMAKLEAAELQLTRWAEPMGLMDDEAAVFKNGSWKEEDMKKVERWLGAILGAFENAKKASDKYKLGFEDEGDEQQEDFTLPSHQEAMDTESIPMKRLVESVRSINKRRQKKISLGVKIGWALHRKSDFESMIDEICRRVDNLVKLFPTFEACQQQLAKAEAKEIKAESFPIFVKVLGKNDEILNRAIADEIKLNGHVFEDVSVGTDGSKLVQLGDKWEESSEAKGSLSSMTFKKLVITGSGNVQAGHYYGSKQ
jgi:hypothetical protein